MHRRTTAARFSIAPLSSIGRFFTCHRTQTPTFYPQVSSDNMSLIFIFQSGLHDEKNTVHNTTGTITTTTFN
jgi:hypothetical protein